MTTLRWEWRKLWRAGHLGHGLCVLLVLDLLLLLGQCLLASPVLPGSYRRAAADLSALPLEAQQAQVEARLAWVLPRWQMTRAFWQAAPPAEETEKPKTFYTSDLTSEVILLRQLQDQMARVQAQQDFLEQVGQQANRLTAGGILAQAGYEQAALTQQVAIYQRLQGLTVNWKPDAGLHTALSFLPTRILLPVLGFVLAWAALTVDSTAGGMSFLLTLPRGRRLFGTRLAVMLLAQLALTTALYGANLLVCCLLYGVPAWQAPIQAFTFGVSCPLRISAAGYLVWYILFQWAALWLVDLLVALCAALRRRLAAVALSAAGLLGLGGLGHFAPAQGPGALVRYASPLFLLDTDGLLGTLTQLRIGDWPVTRLQYTGAVLPAVLLILIPAAWHAQKRMSAVDAEPAKRLPHRRAQGVRLHSLAGAEWYRLLVGQRTALILAGYLLFQCWCGAVSVSYLTPAEMQYRALMQRVSGPYTAKSQAVLLETYASLQEVFALQVRYRAGGLDAETYTGILRQNETLFQQADAFSRVQTILARQQRRPRLQLVYEAGYQLVLDQTGTRAYSQMLLMTAVLLLCGCDLAAADRRTGFSLLAETLPGTGRLFRLRLVQCAVLGGAAGMAALVPQLWQAIRDYGLPCLSAPAASLADYAALPDWFPLWGLLLALALGQMLAGFWVAAFVLALSYGLHNRMAVLAVGGTLLLACPLAAQQTRLRMAGVYALFHAGAWAGQPTLLAQAALVSILLVGILILALCVVQPADLC